MRFLYVPNATASDDVPPVISSVVSDLTATENETVSEMNRLKAELAEKRSYGGGINITTGKTRLLVAAGPHRVPHTSQ